MKLIKCLAYKLWNVFTITIIIASLFSIASTPVYAGFWSDLLASFFGGNTAKKATKDAIEDAATKNLADTENQAAWVRGETKQIKTEQSIEKNVDEAYDARQKKIDTINNNRIKGYSFEKEVKGGICQLNSCSTPNTVESIALQNGKAFLADTSDINKYLGKFDDYASEIKPDLVRVETAYSSRWPYSSYSKITLIEIKSSQSAFDSSVSQFRRYDEYCLRVNRKFGDEFCKVESILQAAQENIVSTYRRNLRVRDCFVEGMTIDTVIAVVGGPPATVGVAVFNYVVCTVTTK